VPRTLSSSDYRKLRELPVTARKTARLTQTQVAEMLDRPQAYVSKYENGERNLDVIDWLSASAA